jgi:hypothetical protein
MSLTSEIETDVFGPAAARPRAMADAEVVSGRRAATAVLRARRTEAVA